MKSLAESLNWVVSTLQSSPYCEQTHILETFHFSNTQFAFKVRAELVTGHVLQVRLYVNGEHTDYAYQLFRNDKPILRWDNKEHFRTLSSYPHHFHNAAGKVEESALTGEPEHDLPRVLAYLVAHPEFE